MNSKATHFNTLVFLLTGVIVFFLMSDKYLNVSGLLLCGIAIVVFLKNNKVFRIHRIVLLFMTLSIYTGIQYIVIMDVSENAMIREMLRYSAYGIVVIIASNNPITLKTAVNLVKLFLTLSFIVQVSQFLDIQYFNATEILINFYGEYPHQNLTTYDNITNFRSGGFLLNPNAYMKIGLLFFAILLQDIYLSINKSNNKISLINNCVFLLINLLSLYMAGSRTGTVILFILIINFVITVLKYNLIKVSYKNVYFALLLFTTVIISVFFLYGNFPSGRMFEVSSGMDDSLAQKTAIFSSYIQDSSIINVIFGIGASDYSSTYSTDFDLGYALVWYGFYGIIFFSILIFYVWSRKKENNQLRLFYNSAALIIFLSALTSGVFFNIRVFSILLLFIFVTYKNTKEIVCEKQGVEF